MAVLDLFPGVLLGESVVTATQFSYQFRFSGPKHPDLLILVTERMRGICKNCPPIECIEMGAKSAENYFDHHDQPFKADLVVELDSILIPMVRIGQFYDLMTIAPYTEDLSQVQFQLFDIKEDGEWTEISGTAFESKDDLKAFIKQRKQWLKEKPYEAAERMDLISYRGGEPALLPNGMKVFHRLEAFWRELVQVNGKYLEILASGNETLIAEQLKSGVAEWGCESNDSFGPVDRCTLLVQPGQLIAECISSLLFIQQTFNMLELSGTWVLFTKNSGNVQTKQWEYQANALIKALKESGISYSVDESPKAHPTVEFQISDSIGELWAGPSLSIKQDGGERASMIYSLLGPVKRLVALLAERKAGLGEAKVSQWL